MKTTTPTVTRAEIKATALKRGCFFFHAETLHADGRYSGLTFARKMRPGMKPLSMLAD